MLPGFTAAGIAAFTMMLLILAACAPRLAAPPRDRSGFYHIVQAGETLYRIGKAYDVSHEELARVNRLRQPEQIRTGQRIFIPGALRQLPVEIITPAEPALDRGWESARAAPRRFPNDAGEQKFIWPVSGAIHSHFGRRGSSFHDGIDIAAPAGTPIHAVEGGEVIYSDQLRGYGNLVIVRHAHGFLSVYAHNEKNLVREGQQLARGDIIARVGSTGRVTGPHLHFEIRRHNKAQDPLDYIPPLCCAGAAASSPR